MTQNQQTLSSDQESYLDREFQFVLNELNREVGVTETRVGRIERTVAFFITVLTALVAASALILTQSSGITRTIALLGSVAIAAGTGFIGFIAIVSLLGQSVVSFSYVIVRRQYFVDNFPTSQKYTKLPIWFNVENEFKDERSEVFFTSNHIIFLHLYALFNSALVAVFISGVVFVFLDWVTLLQNNYVLILSFATGLLTLAVSFLSQRQYLSGRIRVATASSRSILSIITSTEPRVDQTTEETNE